MSTVPGPSGHTYLDFNAPLSDRRAAALVAGVGPLADKRVLDLGCGWAELLLRILAAEPTATGVGIDNDTEHVRAGGVVLVGDGIWSVPPTDAALAALDAAPDDFLTFAALVDAAMTAGFRVLAAEEADRDEWDDFESRWCAGRERWLLANPAAPETDEVRAAVDRHRAGWLHGYRGVLGFAYLTLVADR